MKNLIFLAMVAAFAGCATTEQKPNPYSDYESAMKSEEGDPMAVEWQAENAKAISDETRPEVLIKFVESTTAADGLLNQVKGAYSTCPMVATQIAAVSQLVMDNKCDKAPACRELWTDALLRAAERTKDSYCTMFYLDQLRWCGKRDQAWRILAIGKNSRSRSINDFCRMVVRELKGEQ